MARKGVTYDMVCNAASAIKARGTEPTITSIRVELKDEGSYSTISQHLAKWRAEAADKVTTSPLPPEAEDAAMVAITSIWAIATKHAKQETDAVRQEADDTKKTLSRELEEAKAEITRLEGVYALSLTDAEELNKRLDVAGKTIAGLEGAKQQLERSNHEMLETLKQQGETASQAADTKQAHPSKTTPAPGKKQVANR